MTDEIIDDKSAIIEYDGYNRNRSYLKDKYPTCKKCHSYMYLDDVDYSFQGCQDEYWFCPKCESCMTVKVRYGKVLYLTFGGGK